MSKLKKNLQQFREWARNLMRKRTETKTADSAANRQKAAPKKASTDQKISVNTKAAVTQIGTDLIEKRGFDQGKAVTHNDAPESQGKKQSAGGSSWKYPDPMRRQPSQKQKKGKHL